jgi:DNA-directed RNA polymerase subunit K/omega
LNIELLEQAREKIPSIPVLINAISKRVRQLIAGQRPLVKPLSPDEDKVDIVLREIVEGKLAVEMTAEEEEIPAPPKKEEDKDILLSI